MARMRIEFDGFEKFLEEIERQEKDIKPAVNKALEKTFDVVQSGVEQTIPPHHRSGATEDSMYKTPVVEWTGNVAEVKVGFNLSENVTSQFLIYGAKASITGVPYRPPDMKLWNAIFGSAVTKRIEEIQRNVFEEILK